MSAKRTEKIAKRSHRIAADDGESRRPPDGKRVKQTPRRSRPLTPVQLYQLLIFRNHMREVRWWRHYNFMEVAAMFGIPVTTLRSRYDRQMKLCGNDRELFDRVLDDFERTPFARNMSLIMARSLVVDRLAALEK